MTVVFGDQIGKRSLLTSLISSVWRSKFTKSYSSSKCKDGGVTNTEVPKAVIALVIVRLPNLCTGFLSGPGIIKQLLSSAVALGNEFGAVDDDTLSLLGTRMSLPVEDKEHWINLLVDVHNKLYVSEVQNTFAAHLMDGNNT